MIEQRHHIRLNREFQSRIHLMNSSHSVMTKNISLCGVLVHFPNLMPDIHIGDKCILSIELGHIGRYEVVRVETPAIALRLE
jgi:hypothetical protein